MRRAAAEISAAAIAAVTARSVVRSVGSSSSEAAARRDRRGEKRLSILDGERRGTWMRCWLRARASADDAAALAVLAWALARAVGESTHAAPPTARGVLGVTVASPRTSDISPSGATVAGVASRGAFGGRMSDGPLMTTGSRRRSIGEARSSPTRTRARQRGEGSGTKRGVDGGVGGGGWLHGAGSGWFSAASRSWRCKLRSAVRSLSTRSADVELDSARPAEEGVAGDAGCEHGDSLTANRRSRSAPRAGEAGVGHGGRGRCGDERSRWRFDGEQRGGEPSHGPMFRSGAVRAVSGARFARPASM
jgi:peptidoglycan hydrolase-like protein with peptidoglycan-binding domain